MPKAKKTIKEDPAKVKTLMGKKVLFEGSKESMFECPICKVKRKKAMVSEYAGVLYCSESCVQESQITEPQSDFGYHG